MWPILAAPPRLQGRLLRSRPLSNPLLIPLRRLSAGSVPRSGNTRLPPRIKINEDDITENFIKGGGAGGQKINKTSSQVQLIHHPTGIHVKCQETRSRAQNRTIARRILAERIEELEKGDESRTAIKREQAFKKKSSAMKKSRRKYKKLAEEKADSQAKAAEQPDAAEAADQAVPP